MPAGALERAVELLRRLGEQASEVTVAELAGGAGVPTSTVYRLLAELERHGLVQRGADSTVALGTRLVALGRIAEAGLQERLVAPAAAIMAELSGTSGETAILTAPCVSEAIVLHVVEAEVSVRLSYAVYRRAPIHRGASGKILAAYLEPSERARVVAAAGAEAFGRELDEIRARGFAFTSGELDEGAAAVAAPVLDRRGRIVAGISIAGPSARIVAGRARATAAVLDAARAIERAIARADRNR
ncbi:MAG: IclR family transcriptional regulator [Solirubrobacteraceae bacterium]